MNDLVAGGTNLDGVGSEETTLVLSPAAGGQWSFTIPLLPPSVNALNNIIYSQRRVVTKPEVLKWRSDASCFIPRVKLQSKSSLLRLDALFSYGFYHRNGNLRVLDTQNLMKALIDTIAWKVGFNDNRVKCGSWDSVDAKDELVRVVLKELV